jgi:RNA polymerase sigma-70 factor (ECF subfamily)
VQTKQTIIASWVDIYTPKLYQWALQKCRDQSLAEDLVQDTFLAAFEAFEKFKGDSKPLTWLFGILNNKLNDHFRKSSKMGMESLMAEQQADDLFNEAGHWEKETTFGTWQEEKHLLDNVDFLKIFELCLGNLPLIWRDALLQKYIFEKEAKEICQELGITNTNYWQIVHRGKLLVRKCLEKSWRG